jgi:hypothetical protein
MGEIVIVAFACSLIGIMAAALIVQFVPWHTGNDAPPFPAALVRQGIGRHDQAHQKQNWGHQDFRATRYWAKLKVLRLSSGVGGVPPNVPASLASITRKKTRRAISGWGRNNDWSSHACDAFGLLAVVYEEPPVKSARIRRPSPPRIGSHWSA